MAAGFLRSREFAIALLVAGLLVVGAAGAITYAAMNPEFRVSNGCSLRGIAGTSLPSPGNDTGVYRDGSSARRVVTHTLDPGNVTAGTIAACTEVGRIAVRNSPDGLVRVTLTTTARGFGAEEVLEGAKMEADFRLRNGALSVYAWQAKVAEWDAFFFDNGWSSGRIEIEVPDAGEWKLSLATDVGHVEVEDLRIVDSTLTTDVGEVTLRGVGTNGTLDIHTDVGEVGATFVGVGPGRISIHTDVGEASVELPRRADVGYDVVANADVGDVDVRLGPEASVTAERDGSSKHVSARSAGFAEKPTQVTVRIHTDVGSIDVVAL